MLYIILNESIAFTSEKPSAKRFGLLICEVIPDSITEKAGIIEKDIVYSLNNKVFLMAVTIYSLRILYGILLQVVAIGDNP